MARSREQVLEDALRNTKTELAKNHGRVGKLSKRLRSSERARKGLERDVQHLVLIQKFQGGGINEAGTRHGSQDISDKSPFAGLPDVPSYISQAPKALLTPRPSVSMFPGGATREGVVVLPEEEQKPGRMDTPARAAKRSRGEMESVKVSRSLTLANMFIGSQIPASHIRFPSESLYVPSITSKGAVAITVSHAKAALTTKSLVVGLGARTMMQVHASVGAVCGFMLKMKACTRTWNIFYICLGSRLTMRFSDRQEV